MLDGWARALFGDARRRRACCTRSSRRSCRARTAAPRCALPLPFAERGDIELKKIGLEVIVRVGGQKRTIILPPAMAAYATSGARFEEGALECSSRRTMDAHEPQLSHPGPTARDDRPPTARTPRRRRGRRRGRRRPPPRRAAARLDLAALFVLLDALRRAAPRELQEQFTRLIRESLLTLRSLIDWYLDRLDRPDREPRVEDIPIE